MGNKFDSEAFYERLYLFAFNCQQLVKTLTRSNYNLEYGSQLIRSSSSVGANYIEAIEALSKKDFVHRLRICRKEAGEAVHWLRLISDSNNESLPISNLTKELTEKGNIIKKILASSILTLVQKG